MLPLRTNTSSPHYANSSCNDNSQPFQQQRTVVSNPATYSQKPTIAFEKAHKYRTNVMYLCYTRIMSMILKSWSSIPTSRMVNRHTILQSPLSAGETGKLWKDSKLSEIYKRKKSQLMNKEIKCPNKNNKTNYWNRKKKLRMQKLR